MKKILAVILSLAMILSMTVCAFAAEAPTDATGADAWAAYYTEILMDEELDDEAKAELILNNVPAVDNDTVLINALGTAVARAEAQGVDTTAVAAIVVEKSEEVYGFNIEDVTGSDVDRDGYIGADKKPVSTTDVEGWTAYYALYLGKATTDASAITTVVSTIGGTLLKGEIDRDTFMSAFPAAVAAVGSDVANQVLWGVESLINMDINSDGYIGKPDGSIDDSKLPDDDDNSGSGILGSLSGIFDTVLGVLGSIFDTIFGGGSDDPTTDPSNPDDDNLWGDDNGDDFWGGSDDGSMLPDTGDTTVFAVAAVALAAGAALVMTRKKSEDAE